MVSVQIEMEPTTTGDHKSDGLAGRQIREGGKIWEVVTSLVVIETLATIVPLLCAGPTTGEVGWNLVAGRGTPQTNPLGQE